MYKYFRTEINKISWVKKFPHCWPIRSFYISECMSMFVNSKVGNKGQGTWDLQCTWGMPLPRQNRPPHY